MKPQFVDHILMNIQLSERASERTEQAINNTQTWFYVRSAYSSFPIKSFHFLDFISFACFQQRSEPPSLWLSAACVCVFFCIHSFRWVLCLRSYNKFHRFFSWYLWQEWRKKGYIYVFIFLLFLTLSFGAFTLFLAFLVWNLLKYHAQAIYRRWHFSTNLQSTWLFIRQ